MKTFFRIQVLLILFLFCLLEDCITIGTIKNAFDPEYDRSGIYNSIPLGSAEQYSLGENHSLKIENETGTYCMKLIREKNTADPELRLGKIIQCHGLKNLRKLTPYPLPDALKKTGFLLTKDNRFAFSPKYNSVKFSSIGKIREDLNVNEKDLEELRISQNTKYIRFLKNFTSVYIYENHGYRRVDDSSIHFDLNVHWTPLHPVPLPKNIFALSRRQQFSKYHFRSAYLLFQLEDGEIPEGENFIRLEMINDDFFAGNKWGLLLLPFTLALDAVLWPFEIITLIMLSGWKT